MNEKQKTKLELIRIEGICRMLLQKIGAEPLTDLVESITKSSTQDVKKAIFQLPRYQLIEIIELAGKQITSEDIDNAYEQYRYGLKPGFTLFALNAHCKKVSGSQANSLIKEHLANIKYKDDEKYKQVAAKSYSKISGAVIEFTYSYLSKYSYISEKEEPLYIYEYQECFVWIDTAGGFLAIKNAPERVLSILKKAFSATYSTQITNIKLTKKLIQEIFGNDKIKRGSYINPNASQNEAEKIIIADPHLGDKQMVQDSVSEYDMTGTFLNETVGDKVDSTLGINCNKGKIYLTANVSATDFREWSIDRINRIVSYLSNVENFCDFEIFQAKNITDIPIWDEFSGSQKKLIEKLCYSIYVSFLNKQDSSIFDYNVVQLRKELKKHLYVSLLSYCDICDEPYFPTCECGSTNINVSLSGKMTCNDCDNEISYICCEKGHRHKITDSNKVLTIYPSGELYRKIAKALYQIFQLQIGGSFYIHDGKLVLVKEKKGGIIKIDEVPELRAVNSTNLTEDEYDNLLKSLQSINEKCKNSTNDKCNKCLFKAAPECIMKLFSFYDGYRPSPHQAGEFGDVNFTVTVDEQTVELVGIAKSAEKGKTVLNLSENAAREMLQQVLTATHDARVGTIAAICPMRFHDQLIEELRYLAKLTKKKIVVMDDMFMVRLYKNYKDKQSKP